MRLVGIPRADADGRYLVFEYVEGGELFNCLVNEDKLEVVEAAKYFRQIVTGVLYCHRCTI